MEEVILVDRDDAPVGTAEKLQAHVDGVLHRAFSVFVLNAEGGVLLQRRAAAKYHSGGLWTNTCCSHPRPGEPVERAAHRRLVEEMGFDCELESPFSFIYHADVGQGLTEHELDHVFIGRSDAAPVPNSDEVEGWKHVAPADLLADVRGSPERYTVWFRIALEEIHARGYLA